MVSPFKTKSWIKLILHGVQTLIWHFLSSSYVIRWTCYHFKILKGGNKTNKPKTTWNKKKKKAKSRSFLPVLCSDHFSGQINYINQNRKPVWLQLLLEQHLILWTEISPFRESRFYYTLTMGNKANQRLLTAIGLV